MLKPSLALLLLTLSCVGWAHAATPACEGSFTEEGNLVTGRRFTAERSFPDVASSDAFARTYANIAQQGFTLNDANADAGVITAQQPVTGSDRVVPFNAVVETSADGGSKVRLTFSVAPGMAVRQADVRRGFCEVFTAVAR